MVRTLRVPGYRRGTNLARLRPNLYCSREYGAMNGAERDFHLVECVQALGHEWAKVCRMFLWSQVPHAAGTNRQQTGDVDTHRA